jgi:hypothetical protein
VMKARTLPSIASVPFAPTQNIWDFDSKPDQPPSPKAGAAASQTWPAAQPRSVAKSPRSSSLRMRSLASSSQTKKIPHFRRTRGSEKEQNL